MSRHLTALLLLFLTIPGSGLLRATDLFDDNGSVSIRAEVADGVHNYQIDGVSTDLNFLGGQASLKLDFDRRGRLLPVVDEADQLELFHIARKKDNSLRIKRIPLWLSLLPPLIAIALALIFKEAVVSLFAGVWIGSFIAGGLRFDSIFYFLLSIFQVVEKYVIEALTDGGHMSVIIFTILIGGMVAVISRNGGMAGVVESLSKYAKTRRSTQFVTWLMGVAIFFDDYANTLIVGTTMKSVTDRFRISREKLAYIVDSTAAPVAAVAFITTWIGAELGYIDSGISSLDDFSYSMSPYAIFLSSLKYSFYPFLTLIFILILVREQKDFGPMYRAERRALEKGQVSSAASPDDDEPDMEDLTPVKGAPRKWHHAVIPVATVIIVSVIGLISTGMSSLCADTNGQICTWGNTWQSLDETGFFRRVGRLIGASDSYVALLWASVAGLIIAIAITLWNRIMSLIETMHTMTTGFKTMIPAFIILTLAWSLALTTDQLHTADFLSTALAGNLNPYLLPVLTFVLAALIAFSTGSSWSTMAILYPIVIPTSWLVCQAAGVPDETSLELLFNVISVVLGASVLGDHCSPISDTTILSSLASDCNHIDHVRTQLPYALVVGIISLACGFISTLVGGGWLTSLILLAFSVMILYLIVSKLGKDTSPT